MDELRNEIYDVVRTIASHKDAEWVRDRLLAAGWIKPPVAQQVAEMERERNKALTLYGKALKDKRLLGEALWTYGDRIKMANAPAHLQYEIDEAMNQQAALAQSGEG